MPESSADVLRGLVARVYAALGAGDADELTLVLARDFEGRIAAGMPAGAGLHHGAEAMMRDGWWEIGRMFRVLAEPEEWIPCDGDRLLVRGTYRGSARATGAPVDARFAHLWTGAGGELTALEQWTDTALWQRSLSMQAPA